MSARTQRRRPALVESPLVSVIVTSFSQGRFESLQALLDSLRVQTYRHAEILVVVEGSQDLANRLKRYADQKRDPALSVVIHPGPPGLSAARNTGVERSRGDILAFIDDDAVAFPDWIEGIVHAFAESRDVIGITGPAFPDWEGGPVTWFPVEFYWLLSCPTPGWTGFTTPTPLRTAWGVNMAFRREAFEVARFSTVFPGGERTGADDVDFSMQVRSATRKLILFHPSVCVSHKVSPQRLTTAFILKKAFRDGYAKALLRFLYSDGKEARFDMDLEKALLRRIVRGFLPAMVRTLRRDPHGAWNQFRLATLALSSTGAGYVMGTLSSLVRARGKTAARPRRRDG